MPVVSGMAETRREMALRHVNKGREIIAAQLALIERLRAAGKDTTKSANLLASFERSQAMFVDDLWRLDRKESRLASCVAK